VVVVSIPYGLTPGYPAAPYHLDPAIGGSGDVKALALKSPAHYRHRLAHPFVPSARMVLGSLAHALILEPDEVDQRYVVLPREIANKPATKAWQAWARDALGDADLYAGMKVTDAASLFHDTFKVRGLTVVTEADYDLAVAMRDAINRHPIARPALSGDTEVTVRWDDPATGAPCKGRIDALPTTNEAVTLVDDSEAGQQGVPLSLCAVDLKTTGDASRAAWSTFALERLGMHLQAAHYMRGLSEVGHPRQRWLFVVVEQHPPHGVAVYELLRSSIEAGSALCDKAYRAWSTCTEADDWPGYPEQVVGVGLSEWARSSATMAAADEYDVEPAF